jgi:DNA-binding PadR family transcriptional regulator
VTDHPVPSLPPKERLILELLISHGPLFGLQLVAFSQGSLKRGTVYVTLGRMEAKGFVTSEQEAMPPGAIGLPRRVYQPTPLGERVLRAWSLLARELVEGSVPRRFARRAVTAVVATTGPH